MQSPSSVIGEKSASAIKRPYGSNPTTLVPQLLPAHIVVTGLVDLRVPLARGEDKGGMPSSRICWTSIRDRILINRLKPDIDPNPEIDPDPESGSNPDPYLTGPKPDWGIDLDPDWAGPIPGPNSDPSPDPCPHPVQM
ncbi:hypothetical protein CRG98_045557 [Punica granatum]|uniref:Uncharacterized protein n=1 Tax=Punica granatum TaxID=22663 RepID=A0A2I0HRL2_PUNGR|nr:hypothetical protein CRG98_045557 [Punica granatum]